MQTSRTITTFFSPTGTSKSIALAVGEGLNSKENEEVDITTNPAGPRVFSASEFVVFSVPVYAGRVAPQAVERMEGISANGTPAAAVVVYGNREYEDALLELKNILSEKGFKLVGAAAFIGEHSFSTPSVPIAVGRPDQQDIQKAVGFGRQLAAKDFSVKKDIPIPGNFPYKEGVQNNPVSPQCDQEKCVLCRTCEAVCPVGAVTVKENVLLNGTLCILCCACIKNCPEQALSMTALPLLEKANWLAANYSARKEPELFL